jgi:hypothetical protein
MNYIITIGEGRSLSFLSNHSVRTVSLYFIPHCSQSGKNGLRSLRSLFRCSAVPLMPHVRGRVVLPVVWLLGDVADPDRGQT